MKLPATIRTDRAGNLMINAGQRGSWVARRDETAPGGAASSQERKPVTVELAIAISTGA
jgi:hypothetical protein